MSRALPKIARMGGNVNNTTKDHTLEDRISVLESEILSLKRGKKVANKKKKGFLKGSRTTDDPEIDWERIVELENHCNDLEDTLEASQRVIFNMQRDHETFKEELTSGLSKIFSELGISVVLPSVLKEPMSPRKTSSTSSSSARNSASFPPGGTPHGCNGLYAKSLPVTHQNEDGQVPLFRFSPGRDNHISNFISRRRERSRRRSFKGSNQGSALGSSEYSFTFSSSTCVSTETSEEAETSRIDSPPAKAKISTVPGVHFFRSAQHTKKAKQKGINKTKRTNKKGKKTKKTKGLRKKKAKAKSAKQDSEEPDQLEPAETSSVTDGADHDTSLSIDHSDQSHTGETSLSHSDTDFDEDSVTEEADASGTDASETDDPEDPVTTESPSSHVSPRSPANSFENFRNDLLLDAFQEEDFPCTLEWGTAVVEGGALPSPRCWASSCSFNDGRCFAIAGGFDVTSPYPNDVNLFDVDSMRWQILPEMKVSSVPRYAHAIDCVNEELFVFGGDSTRVGYLNDVYLLRADLSKGPIEVKPLGNPPLARAATASVSIGELIYYFGGDSGSETGYHNDLHVLNATTLTWVNIEPPVGDVPEPRGWHTVSRVGAFLFVFGGYNGARAFNDVHILDTRSTPMRWIKPHVNGVPPAPRHSHSAVVYDQHLLVMFGTGEKTFNDVFAFNTQTMTWVKPRMTGRLPSPRYGMSAFFAEHQKRVYIFGGYDGDMVFGEFLTISIESQPSIKPPADSLGSDLSSLIGNKDFSDVTFVVEGKEVYAHKNIISCRSSYFSAMFSSFAEREKDVIEISDIPYDVFLVILRYLYTGNFDYIVSDNVVEVLKVANMLNMKDIIRACERVLECHMEPSNAVWIFSLARTYNTKALLLVAVQFIVQNFDVVSKTTTFKELDEDAKDILLVAESQHMERRRVKAHRKMLGL